SPNPVCVTPAEVCLSSVSVSQRISRLHVAANLNSPIRSFSRSCCGPITWLYPYSTSRTPYCVMSAGLATVGRLGLATIRSFGVSAHWAAPEGGKNAPIAGAKLTTRKKRISRVFMLRFIQVLNEKSLQEPLHGVRFWYFAGLQEYTGGS